MALMPFISAFLIQSASHPALPCLVLDLVVDVILSPFFLIVFHGIIGSSYKKERGGRRSASDGDLYMTATRVKFTGSRQEGANTRNITNMIRRSDRLFLTIFIITVIVIAASLKVISSPEVSIVPVTAEEHILLTSAELAYGQREEKRYRLFACHSGVAPKNPRGQRIRKEDHNGKDERRIERKEAEKE